MRCSFLATLALLSSRAITTPAPSVIPKPPSDSLNISISVPETRVTTYPVCGTLGFTSEPGDNDLGIFPSEHVCLEECLQACFNNSTCKAVSYAEKFQLCSFYGDEMRFDHLDEDDTSNYAHYDETCYVEGEEGKGKGEEGKGKEEEGNGGEEGERAEQR